jgi:RNA polymerase sigma factor (sigma-70 family)
MAEIALQLLLRNLRLVSNQKGGGALTDAQLLERFVESRDASAFEVLVWRHGPLVLGTCRKLLGQEQDAEDAFQATFMVLARKAASIANGASLPGWLYQVACRIAYRLRSQSRYRQIRQQHDVDLATLPARSEDHAAEREWDCVLAEELDQLPTCYRGPLIACYLQGKTHQEAARELGRPLGSMSHLLARGRELLRQRLSRRGATLSTALLAAMLADQAAAVSTAQVLPTVTAALAYACGTPEPGRAVILANGILHVLAFGRVKMAAASLLLISALVAGAAGWTGTTTAPALHEQARTPGPPTAIATEGNQPRLDFHGDPLPEGALLRFGTIRFRHPGGVHGVALSPDGKTLATEGSGTVRLWNTATGKPGFVARNQASNYGAAQNALAFSPDGQRVYLSREEGVGSLNLATGETTVVCTLMLERPVGAVHASPDGRFLAVGTNVGVRLVELSSGRTLWTIPIRSDDFSRQGRDRDRLLFPGRYSLALFAPDGKTVAVNACDNSKVVRLVEAATGAERLRIALGARLVRLAWSHDGRRLAATERDNAVRVYDVADGRRLHSWTVNLTNPNENYTSAIAFSPAGTTLAVGATDHLVHLWDLKSGREMPALRGHGWYVSGLVFAPDGRFLYSVGWDGNIRCWDTATWRERPAPMAATGTVARAPVGSIVAWEGDGGVVHLSDAVTGRMLRTLPGKAAGFTRLVFSPDEAVLAAAGNDLSVQLWDVASGKLRREWSWPKGKDGYQVVEDMAFAPDGKTLATADFRGSEVLLWDTQSGTRLGRAAHQMAFGVVYGHDGRTLITVGWDRALRWWSLPGLQALGAMILPAGTKNDLRLHAITASADGRRLATIDLGGGISVWDAASHQVLRSFPALMGQCRIALSPDGQWLTVGGYSGEVALWDVNSGQQVWKPVGHPSRVFQVAFSPDGRTLLTGSDDSTVLVWDLRPKSSAKESPGMTAWWDALAGADAAAAYRAMWRLAERPDRSVPLLKEKLAPVKPVAAERVQDLLKGLDGDRFAQRRAAARALAALGEAAEPELRRALAQGPSAEKRQALEALIQALAESSFEGVRRTRAVTVLRWAHTQEARQLLQELAAGMPEAALTRLAKVALHDVEHE